MENARLTPFLGDVTLLRVQLKSLVEDERDGETEGERRGEGGIVKGSKFSRRDDFTRRMSRTRSRSPVDNMRWFFFAQRDEGREGERERKSERRHSALEIISLRYAVKGGTREGEKFLSEYGIFHGGKLGS